MHSYTLVRSKRKTIAIHIVKDASVEVRAPLRAPASAINAFVASKDDWITARLGECRVRLEARAAFELRYGDMLPLCGRLLPIRAGGGKSSGFDGNGFLLPPDMEPAQIKLAVVKLYKRAAKSILEQKTAYYAKLLGVTPSGVSITSAKSRWGSCSGKNSISYSWRLVMADEETVDYVVVHELAHIKEHNHSVRFWKIVESVIPDHKQHRARLRALSDKLSREDWE